MRVGANAVFSFGKDSRTLNLERGSLLLHSPTGKGGGSIVTNSATASVVGTTIIVTATSNGGFKLLVLEGVAQVKYPDGRSVTLNAGQMTFILPGRDAVSGEHGPVLDFELDAMVAGAALLEGFSRPLPSIGKIREAAHGQNVSIGRGELVRTGYFILGVDSPDEFYVVAQDAIRQAKDPYPEPVLPPAGPVYTDRYRYTGGLLPEIYLHRVPVPLAPYGEVTGMLLGHLGIDAPVFELATLDGLARVDVIAAATDSLEIFGSVDFSGLSVSRRLRVGGGALEVMQGSLITFTFADAPATSAAAEVISLTPIALTSVSFAAPGVTLAMTAPGISLTGGALSAGPLLELRAGTGDLRLDATTLTADALALYAPGDVGLFAVSGGSTVGGIVLDAGGALSITGGDLAAATDFTLHSGTPIALTNARLKAQTGTLTFDTSSLNVVGGELSAFTGLALSLPESVSLTNVQVSAASGDVLIVAPVVSVASSSVTAGGLSPAYPAGAVTLRSTRADLVLRGDDVGGRSLVRAERGAILIEAPWVVDLYGTDVESRDQLGAGAAGAVSVRAATLVRIRSGTIAGGTVAIDGNAFGSGATLEMLTMDGVSLAATNAAVGVSLSAKTLNLSNVTLSSDCATRLRSQDGVLNVGTSMFGAVNFVSGVTLGGAAPADLMTVSGIKQNVWIESGVLYFKGMPSGSSNPKPETACIHIQALGAADVPTRFTPP